MMKKKRKRRRRRRVRSYISVMLAYAIIATMVVLITYFALCIYDSFARTKESDVTFVWNDVMEWNEEIEETIFHGEGKGKCVILDAGHGGEDGGTASGKVNEKDINLAVTMYVKEYLEQAEVDVILTRSKDDYLSLEERTELANKTTADLFVSVHCNYYEDSSSIYGVECYYYPGLEDGRKCAETLLDAMRDNQDIHVRNAKEEDYYVLKHTQMTAVLVEIGYLSNQKECKNLTDPTYQKTLAKELAEGILQSLDNSLEF